MTGSTARRLVQSLSVRSVSALRRGSEVCCDAEGAAELRHVVTIAFRRLVALVEVDLLFGGQAGDWRPVDGACHEAGGRVGEGTLGFRVMSALLSRRRQRPAGGDRSPVRPGPSRRIGWASSSGSQRNQPPVVGAREVASQPDVLPSPRSLSAIGRKHLGLASRSYNSTSKDSA